MIGVALGLLFTTGTAHAVPQGLAVGAQLGEPVAATAAYRWNEEMTVQLAQGWSFGQKRFHMSLDYLYTFAEIDADEGMGLSYPVYVGAGLRLRAFGTSDSASEERGNFGFRFPIGAAVSPDHIPVEVYFEMAPVWVVAPISHGGFDGGIGGRLFF
jgi:hypothetical protein